jgi:hypothetical protein
VSEYIETSITFPNILAVVDYLKAMGWKVGKSIVYQHRNGGKLRPRADGLYHLKDVERYARTFLRRTDTGQPACKDIDDVQQDKSRAERDKMVAQADVTQMKRDVLKGKYVEKDYLDQELARRAALLNNDLITFSRTSAVEIIALVGGDPDRVPDLIEHMIEAMESFLDRYAEDREFNVPTPVVSDIDDQNEGDEGDDGDEID